MEDQTAWYWAHHPGTHNADSYGSACEQSPPRASCQCSDEMHRRAGLGRTEGCDGGAVPQGKVCAWCLRYHQAAAREERNGELGTTGLHIHEQ